MSSVHLSIEVGYGCPLSVASNGFVRTNLTFTCRKKIMHPYEWGILGVKAIALLLAIARTISSRSSTSAGCFACKHDSGRAKALGIRRQSRTAPTGLCGVRRRSILKAAVLYTNWLALAFNIDSRSRQAQFYQSPNCPIKLSCLDCPECA